MLRKARRCHRSTPMRRTEQPPRPCPLQCEHHTKPTHTSHFRTRDFSCVAQDLSLRVNKNVVSQNSLSSNLAQHIARALVVVSLPDFPHALQSDLPSVPDLHSSRTHGLCLSGLWLYRTRLQVMNRKISLKRTPPCWSNRCSCTDRV